jgi:hypothetical protein
VKLLSLVFIWSLLLLIPRPWAERILAEGGPVEMPTAIAYFVAALLLWFSSTERRGHSEFAAIILLIAGGLRELDFQARFTNGYAFSSSYFLRGAAPFWEKTVVVLVLALLASAFAVLVLAEWRRFPSALFSAESWAISVTVAIGFITLSTSLDEIGGYLRRNYAATATDALFILWVFEETLEALVPVLFATAVIQSARMPRAARRSAA